MSCDLARDHQNDVALSQLRGIEGARVRKTYELLAKRHGLKWEQRKYDPNNWDSGDLLNRCVSAANACLYGITEAAVLAAGYAPAVGFIHTGKSLSFVYDIADISSSTRLFQLPSR